MTRGPYSLPDGPPAGWPTHHQYEWLYPPDDPYDFNTCPAIARGSGEATSAQTQPEPSLTSGAPAASFVVTGGAGGHEPPAPAGTRHPDRSHTCVSSPKGESRPDAQLPDVSDPASSRGRVA